MIARIMIVRRGTSVWIYMRARCATVKRNNDSIFDQKAWPPRAVASTDFEKEILMLVLFNGNAPLAFLVDRPRKKDIGSNTFHRSALIKIVIRNAVPTYDYVSLTFLTSPCWGKPCTRLSFLNNTHTIFGCLQWTESRRFRSRWPMCLSRELSEFPLTYPRKLVHFDQSIQHASNILTYACHLERSTTIWVLNKTDCPLVQGNFPKKTNEVRSIKRCRLLVSRVPSVFASPNLFNRATRFARPVFHGRRTLIFTLFWKWRS